jgi:hypothetical protein
MLAVLDEHGPVMDGEQFARRSVEAGINPTSFYIYRLISPLITCLGKGLYCRVGIKVPPGTIEDMIARRSAVVRVSDHGWTSKGQLWFGTELSIGNITIGGLRLPPFVADLTQGEWDVVLADDSNCGKVICKGVFAHSFRRALKLLGAEPMDLVVLEFDLTTHKVSVRVGGPGLFEQIEDPESSQAEIVSDDI